MLLIILSCLLSFFAGLLVFNGFAIGDPADGRLTEAEKEKYRVPDNSFLRKFFFWKKEGKYYSKLFAGWRKGYFFTFRAIHAFIVIVCTPLLIILTIVLGLLFESSLELLKNINIVYSIGNLIIYAIHKAKCYYRLWK